MSNSNDIARLGHFPTVELRIRPLDTAKPVLRINRFFSYKFDASILVPASSFSFTWSAPADRRVVSDYLQSGDIAYLTCADQVLSTGIIDSVDISVDRRVGERITVSGRDLMGQLQDQDSVNIDSSTIWGNNMTPLQVYQALSPNTRILALRLQDVPNSSSPWLFATEPNESKLTGLLRYLEPLNYLAWMDPDGKLVIGRPNMVGNSRGVLTCDRNARSANVQSIRANFAESTVANVIVPVWAGQETVQERVGKEQQLQNIAEGPARLLTLGQKLPRAVVVSSPEGANVQTFNTVNRFRAGGSNILQAYAKREMARENVKELEVQANLYGHLDGNGVPLLFDQLYDINFDRAFRQPIQMYCHTVSYFLEEGDTQKTSLFFTKKGTIVSDIRVQ